MQDDANIGYLDRTLRIFIGIIALAWAMELGFNDTGWNWLGWFGMIPLLSGLVGVCPTYRLLGITTCRRAAV